MKKIFIERKKELLRIAVKEKDELKECFIEEETGEPYPGEIYKGIVKNIVPAIKCAFIDIGHKKNVYMYLDEKFKNTKLKKGEELLVQVIKEDLGSKGAKVTNAISLPGTYCVLETFSKDISFSKKIKERSIKDSIAAELIKPEDVGIKIRTNGAEVSISKINDEIKDLYTLYKDMLDKANYTTKLGIVFDDGGILGRVLRDKLSGNNFKVYVDNKEDYRYISNFLSGVINTKTNMILHEEGRSLFSYYGIERELLSLKNNKVPLKCGGYIIIDKTEAMYVIDVNSGKNVRNSSIEKTAFFTNYQAAEEISKQIRLRNLSGIIVIDFIDMDNGENKKKVLYKLQEGFLDDKNKTVVYNFTDLNLVQIARRRSGKCIYEYIEEDCKTCEGKGKRVKFDYLCMLIDNEIIRIDEQRDIHDIHIELDEIYAKDVQGDIIGFVKSIDALDKNIYVTYRINEHFKVEPLIFHSQIESLEKYKIYDSGSI
ncbi:Rne/Rng family ribonuclease [Clostridiaceae bacterium UIB06]|uniref:Rne/Rng family ribonuclease n=1 Tax=Clostridium thailandense TaxID=2794346 RepID=A0A949X3X1_9CLOT|nr:Rne/Rng family ribonuclease [Clostridium thailandense]MBV7273063.1 Rne/Rng family ribonuclease [Clostridium thailandense]MCH5135727.1 Rne/Rng family ribonuclease [Clostridiaceae bacterium UIB06]